MMSRSSSGHVFLVGFMGAGKSTVGRLLAEMLARPFVDLDAEIERRAGRSCAQIFADGGEEAFRNLESAALAGLADVEPSVVACGGGIVLLDANRRLLRELGTVVHLEVTAGEALGRIGNVEGRPLLAESEPAATATLLQARTGLYRASADISVDTVGRHPDDVASYVAAALEHEGAAR